MLIDYILDNAKNRYGTFQGRKLFCGASCQVCTNTKCTGDCGQCLRYIHWPQKAQEDGIPPREYDCVNMADYYVLQFGVRYASEILYAWGNANQNRKYEMSVLSIGCGPCTDLFAFDYLLQKKQIALLNYYGTDLNYKGVWTRLHTDIKNYALGKYKVHFNYDNANNISKDLDHSGIVPNVLVFQYVFSDMLKRFSEYEINSYIKEVAKYINNIMPPYSVIIINDINNPKGGRDYFYYLAKQISPKILYIDTARYFHNNYKGNDTQAYGVIYETNKLLFSDVINIETYQPYYPKLYCASAQRIIVTGRR